MTDNGTACFLVPSSLSQPRHVFSSDHSMSYSTVCTHPPSTTRSLSTLHRFFFLAKPGLAPARLFPSTPRTRAVLPISSSRLSWLASEAYIFFTSCGQTNATCTTDSKVCHCGHWRCKSGVSHMTADASILTCLHACTSKMICFLHAFCCSLLHLPIRTPSAQKERGNGG